jgi:hypothetical protein
VIRALAIVALVGVALPAAAETQRCALVVASDPGPDPVTLEAVRTALASQCRFAADATLQTALEGFARRPLPGARVRDALVRAHARLRRFDADGVRHALDEASAAAGDLPPTPEARVLAAEVRVQEAELALVQNDSAAGLRAMRLALAANAALTLDESRATPPLLALLLRARADLAQAGRVAVTITSQPAGARVWAEGGWRGETPLVIELPRGPTLVWFARDGFRIRTLIGDASTGATLQATLEALNSAERVSPLVDAVRQTAGGARREAALALAGAIAVDAIVVVEAGASPQLYARPLALAPARREPARRASPLLPQRPWYKPWYRKAWPWILVVGGAAAAATAVAVGVTFGNSTTTTLTCCR